MLDTITEIEDNILIDAINKNDNRLEEQESQKQTTVNISASDKDTPFGSQYLNYWTKPNYEDMIEPISNKNKNSFYFSIDWSFLDLDSNESVEISTIEHLINRYDDSIEYFNMREKWKNLNNKLIGFSDSANYLGEIPQPNSFSIETAKIILSLSEKNHLVSIHMNHHADGGILFKYALNDNRFIITIHNDEEIIFLKGKNDGSGDVKNVTIDNLPDIISEILLYGGS